MKITEATPSPFADSSGNVTHIRVASGMSDKGDAPNVNLDELTLRNY